MSVANRRLLFAVAAIGLLNIVALSGSALFQSYDAQTHLFFADHYRQAWFSPWEPKWFDGMWVLSYPPLVHQLIALVGAISDVELGYRIVQGAALLLFPLAIRQLAIEMVGPRCARRGWRPHGAPRPGAVSGPPRRGRRERGGLGRGTRPAACRRRRFRIHRALESSAPAWTGSCLSGASAAASW